MLKLDFFMDVPLDKKLAAERADPELSAATVIEATWMTIRQVN